MARVSSLHLLPLEAFIASSAARVEEVSDAVQAFQCTASSCFDIVLPSFAEVQPCPQRRRGETLVPVGVYTKVKTFWLLCLSMGSGLSMIDDCGAAILRATPRQSMIRSLTIGA
jgi:hypothetical protein